MRKIKFRAVVTSRTIIYFTFADLLNDKFSNRELLHPWLIAGNEPDEFTGLKDKNGKEIYEGDIIKYGSDRIRKIIYFEEEACFKALRMDFGIEYLYYVIGYLNLEIIGNIHKNPELMMVGI